MRVRTQVTFERDADPDGWSLMGPTYDVTVDVSGVFVPAWEPEQGNGEWQLVHFDCAEWLDRTERSDAEEALWDEFFRKQEMEAA